MMAGFEFNRGTRLLHFVLHASPVFVSRFHFQLKIRLENIKWGD